jgi:hypothetical protein
MKVLGNTEKPSLATTREHMSFYLLETAGFELCFKGSGYKIVSEISFGSQHVDQLPRESAELLF